MLTKNSAWKALSLLSTILLCVEARALQTGPEWDQMTSSRTVPVHLRALDADGHPVSGAVIFAYCESRMLMLAAPGEPACRTDNHGRADFRALPGEWTLYGVGTTSEQHGRRGWTVCVRGVRIEGTNAAIEMRAEQTLLLATRNLKDKTLRDVQVLSLPEEWAPVFRPLVVPMAFSEGAKVETGADPRAVWWLGGRIEGNNPKGFFLRGQQDSSEGRRIRWDADPRLNTEIRVKPDGPLPKGVRGYLLVESLDFHLNGVCFFSPLDRSGASCLVTPGELSVRHYWEWGDTARSYFHAEFCNENFRGSPGQMYPYVPSPRLTVAPVIDIRERRLELWLDTLDASRHGLAFMAPPHDKPVLGTLELFDARGRRTHSLDVGRDIQAWDAPETNAFPTEGTYRFSCDLKGLGVHRREGKIPRPGTTIASVARREHLSLRYPVAGSPDGQKRLDRQAAACADDMEELVRKTYGWYGLSAPTGFDCVAGISPPTAGGSSGRFLIFFMGYLQGWDARRPIHPVPVHEFGHSLHGVEPLHVFFTGEDQDHVGLYNESQASFMGSIGVHAVHGPRMREAEFLGTASGVFRFLDGSTNGIPDIKARLCYLTLCLQRWLGDDFTRRSLRLAHLAPATVRDQIRAQPWTPEEKVCALFTVAARRDLGPVFRGMRFAVREEVGERALREWSHDLEP